MAEDAGEQLLINQGARQALGDDYDYAAAQAAGVKPDETGHWPDTFKKPTHITFSDESKFDDGGAGHWQHLGGDRWSFTPGPTNLKYHSMDELRAYFKKQPNLILLDPATRTMQIIDDAH
jgi:hypothetical protein